MTLFEVPLTFANMIHRLNNAFYFFRKKSNEVEITDPELNEDEQSDEDEIANA